MTERLTIVCLSSQPWGDNMWTNKQHVMDRIANEHRVIFVDFGGESPFKFLRREGVAGSRRSPLTLRRPAVRRIREGLEVLGIWAPPWFNFLKRSHRLREWNDFDHRIEVLTRWLREQGISNVIVWVYHPGYGASVTRLPHRLIVYDCVDEYSAFPEFRHAQEWIRSRERELGAVADLVTCTAPSLLEAKRDLAPGRVHLVHNVGDYDHFQRALLAETIVPAELSGLARPIVGFIGAVSDYKLNADWLLALARQRPEASVVLIGPTGVADPATDVAKLLAQPNVVLLGHRPYAALPAYIKGFDVVVIPYRINDYTRAVFPIKFFEMLATGKPVVISALPAVQAYWDFVQVAHSAQEFVDKCALAPESDSQERRKARLELARQNSWPSRVRRLLELVSQALEAPRAQRR